MHGSGGSLARRGKHRSGTPHGRRRFELNSPAGQTARSVRESAVPGPEERSRAEIAVRLIWSMRAHSHHSERCAELGRRTPSNGESAFSPFDRHKTFAPGWQERRVQQTVYETQ